MPHFWAEPGISSFVLQVSERDTVSQSADSPATDVAVSTSHNGPLTSGTSEPFSRLALVAARRLFLQET